MSEFHYNMGWKSYQDNHVWFDCNPNEGVEVVNWLDVGTEEYREFKRGFEESRKHGVAHINEVLEGQP